MRCVDSRLQDINEMHKLQISSHKTILCISKDILLLSRHVVTVWFDKVSFAEKSWLYSGYLFVLRSVKKILIWYFFILSLKSQIQKNAQMGMLSYKWMLGWKWTVWKKCLAGNAQFGRNAQLDMPIFSWMLNFVPFECKAKQESLNTHTHVFIYIYWSMR